VLQRIEPIAGRIAEVARRSYCELAVVLYLNDCGLSLPSVAFDKKTLAMLARIEANVDFDLYVVAEGE
jgi:hypothetical protein